MGRQINLWMNRSDEEAFVGRLREDDCVWSPYQHSLGSTPAPLELDRLIVDGPDRVCVLRRADWAALRWKHVPENPLPDWDGRAPFTPWTMVGSAGSPSFRWSRCRTVEGVVRRGRIWMDSRAGLPDDVLRWFHRCCGWVRRRSASSVQQRYVLPGAARAAEEGRLELRR